MPLALRGRRPPRKRVRWFDSTERLRAGRWESVIYDGPKVAKQGRPCAVTQSGVSRRGRSRRRPPDFPAGAAVKRASATESRHLSASFHRRITAVHPAVNRVGAGSTPAGGAAQRRRVPVEQRLSSPVSQSGNEGSIPSRDTRSVPRAEAAGLPRIANVGSISPTPAAQLARIRARCSTAEHFPDEEEVDGSTPSARTDEPPFHGWDAALRTLTARVRVLPAVPHESRSGTNLASKTGYAGFDTLATCRCRDRVTRA